MRSPAVTVIATLSTAALACGGVFWGRELAKKYAWYLTLHTELADKIIWSLAILFFFIIVLGTSFGSIILVPLGLPQKHPELDGMV